MNTESIQYQADHAEMRPAVNVTRMGKLWRITWGEPRNGRWPLWHAYQQHCQADLVPRLRSAWPGWCSLVGKGSRMAMASGSFGFLHYAPEEVAHEAVEIIRAAEANDLPPRIAASPDFHVCHFYPFHTTCWEKNP